MRGQYKLMTESIPAFWQRYQETYQQALAGVEIQWQESTLSQVGALDLAFGWLTEMEQSGAKLLLAGNGGSAGIASHMAVDFWKNGGVRAMSFNDPSVLTCLANDDGYENIFAVGVEAFAEEEDIYIGISCSGESQNVIRGAMAAKKQGCRVISFTGFGAANTLREMSDLSFYVPCTSYGLVESIHQYLIHSLLDVKMYCADKADIFDKNRRDEA